MGGSDVSDISGAVVVAHIRAKAVTGALLPLHGEGEEAVCRQCGGSRGHQRLKVAEIDQHIRRNDEISLAGLSAQEIDDIACRQLRIEAGCVGQRHHTRRQVDAGNRFRIVLQHPRHQAGAAAQIKHAAEMRLAPGIAAGSQDRCFQDIRAAILQGAGQVIIKSGGVLIEEATDIGSAHFRCVCPFTKPGEMQAGGKDIIQIKRGAMLQRITRAFAVPGFFPRACQGKPARGPARHEIRHLSQKIGGGGKIALLDQPFSPGITPVGEQIAGGGHHGKGGFHLPELGAEPANVYINRMRPSDLLIPMPAGLYCPPADIYIDPVRPVDRALITHGHADHARAGHGAVLATRETLGIMAVRYGENFTASRQIAMPGESVTIKGVSFTFVPAGHVLGSAQIAVETEGLRIVVSGDYKRASDPTCAPFQPVTCDVFITEATFGLPVFRHPDAAGEVAKLLASVTMFPERAHIVGAYSLGKAQRMVALIRQASYDAPVYIHGAMEKLTEFYAGEGIQLGEISKVATADRKSFGGAIVICPPSAIQDLWSRKFPDPVTAFASGWMRTRARARQRGVELPLIVSDHADWDELCTTIREVEAGEVWVTHGQEDALVHWCQSQGIRAKPLRLAGYGDEGEAEPEIGESSQALGGQSS